MNVSDRCIRQTRALTERLNRFGTVGNAYGLAVFDNAWYGLGIVCWCGGPMALQPTQECDVVQSWRVRCSRCRRSWTVMAVRAELRDEVAK